MNGTVTGGWSFVWAAYALTAAALFLYGVTLITRLREEKSRVSRQRETQ